MENFTTQYRVYYEDTDAGGVVYYANYLKFAERARTDALRKHGIDQSLLMKQEGIAFVVHHVDATFHKPAKLDDMLDVSVTVAEVKGAMLTMVQEILCNGMKLCSLKVDVISVDATNFKPLRLPDGIKQKLGL